MNELALNKVKGLLNIALISLMIVMFTATLLRLGLAPRTAASSNNEYVTSQATTRSY